MNGDDLKSSFWTSIGGVGGKRIAAGARVDILEEPNPGEKGSTQNKIYLINTTFS